MGLSVKEAIRLSGTTNPLASGSTNAAQKMLLPDETIVHAVNANITTVPSSTKLDPKKIYSVKGKENGVVVITGKRVFFCQSILGQTKSKEMALNQVQSVDDASNVMFGAAQVRIRGITETFLIDLQHRHLSEFRSRLNSALSAAKQPGSVTLNNYVGTSLSADLRELKQLADDGIITQAEFEAKKRQILGI